MLDRHVVAPQTWNCQSRHPSSPNWFRSPRSADL
uniref:GSVIVT01029553001 n=1 Tax=Arundo donax TaxID=35708 RepID=A0A0A9M7Y6_ARUDO